MKQKEYKKKIKKIKTLVKIKKKKNSILLEIYM